MPGQAHAVGAERARLGHARHDVTAGTHAKREQVVRAVGDQRVVGGAEPLLQWRRAVLDAVDQLLGVLDANAHLERLRHHRHAAAQQHLVGVAGAVADGQDRDRRGQVARRRVDAAQLSVAQVQVLDTAGKAHLAAQRLDAAAQGLDHSGQSVAAEVRPGFVDDRRLALAVGEQLQNAANVGAGVAVGQFAVAEGAGAAFAEKVVALGVVWAALVEGADVADAVAHRPAALQHQRPIALLGQEVRRHETARSGADHHRAITQRSRAGPRQREGFFVIEVNARDRVRSPAGTLGDGGFVFGQSDFGGVNELQGGLVAGVEALAENSPAQRGLWREAQDVGQPLRQGRFRFVNAQADVVNAQRHGGYRNAPRGGSQRGPRLAAG